MDCDSQPVFIVDDDSFWMQLLTRMLKNLGYTCVKTYRGIPDCIHELQSNPGLLFLGNGLKEKGGPALAEHIRKSGLETLLIICSASDDFKSRTNKWPFEDYTYISKLNCTRIRLTEAIQDARNNRGKVY